MYKSTSTFIESPLESVPLKEYTVKIVSFFSTVKVYYVFNKEKDKSLNKK